MSRVDIDPAFFEEMVYDGVMLLLIGHAVVELVTSEGPQYAIESVHNPSHAAYESMAANGFSRAVWGINEINICRSLANRISQEVPDIDDPSTNNPTIEIIGQYLSDKELAKRHDPAA